ncbi:MAG: prepilin-type N-terminal cleavage/methylation domain-containing protein, partial [Ruminococcus callidus]|nr:prepilin-type N-terminal cleavage/methylation domain-containing protein [Ruminococcus callidus]
MKRNRKGFSLVELIVVLVIMAIIAALCAPNISAYVQAAKVQNYQTVANNLADELQTQLPQSRYWNWDEVQRNAYGILCADAGRCVTLDTEKSTDNQKVYQITGASSDANAVFTVTLTYHDAVKTSQKVDIAVSCDGYAAVQSVQECNLVLKTNYTDASAYPMTTIKKTTTNRNGNVTLLDDRVKKWKDDDGNTSNDWSSAFSNKFYPDNDFVNTYSGTSNNPPHDNCAAINLTDYPLNSVSQVEFSLQRYSFLYNYNGTDVVYRAVVPCVEAQKGDGRGGEYAACGTDVSGSYEVRFQNVKVLVDSDLDDDNSWVNYTDVFAENNFPYDISQPGLSPEKIDAVNRYKAYYGDVSYGKNGINDVGYGMSDVEKQINVIYRVKLVDPTDATNRNIRSKCWVAIWGRITYSDSGTIVEPCSSMQTKADGTLAKIYDNVRIKVEIPDYIEDFSTVIQDESELTTENNTFYFDYSGLFFVPYSWGGGYWSYEGYQILVGSNNLLQQIIKDGTYYYDYGTYKDGYYTLPADQQAIIQSIVKRGGTHYKGTFAIDLRNSGYAVGDVVKIQFTNVDADEFIRNANGNDKFLKMYRVNEVTGNLVADGDNTGIHFYDSADLKTANLGKVEKISDNTVAIYILMKWSDYPYYVLSYKGVYADFQPDADTSFSWAKKSEVTTEETTTQNTPMLT